MATIDIRATVTCSLGPLVSAELSDDYLQGNGLVKCKGSCEIADIVTPAIGTLVTFTYIKEGVTRTLPRKLRVLSSFADPFRRTTKVELGCKLTYLADLKPAPTVNGDVPVETGKRQQCLNGYLEFPVNSAYGVPITASGLMQSCLTQLGVTASSNPLTNRFSRETFDFSAGYVNILGDLLLSESYCGYLDANEVLQVFFLDEEAGAGPVLTAADIIDINNIGVGALPADAVVVRYDSLKLKQNLGQQTASVLTQRAWTYDEVVGDVQSSFVRYTVQSTGATGQQQYTYAPYTKTVSEYGTDNSWNDNSCVIVSFLGEGADLSNSVVRRTTRQNVIKAEVANDYCAQLLGYGIDPNAAHQAEKVTEEINEYDNYGQIVRKITTNYEPYFALAGRFNLELTYPVSTGVDYITLSDELILVEKTIVDTTTLYADLPAYIYQDPCETYKKLPTGQKTVTTVYQNWGLSQQGQQAIAAIRQNAPFNSAAACFAYLEEIKDKLVLVDTTIQSSSDRTLIGIEKRPPVQTRIGGDAAVRRDLTSELRYAMGSPTASRILELSMPYQDDDYYTSTGAVVKGTASAKANRYGRVQNRLLLGNRNGISVQLAPESVPSAPFAPLYVQANGLTALYRSNGTNWAVDANGIVCSVDALFWGGVGGTGTFWFPVAPGVTSLPTTPPTVDGQISATNVVLPYNEIALYDARVRVSSEVTKFDYPLALLTVVNPFVVRTQLLATTFRCVLPAATNSSLQTQAPAVQAGVALLPPVVAVSVATMSPALGLALTVVVPPLEIFLAALDPQDAGPLNTLLNPPTAAITLLRTDTTVLTGTSVSPSAADLTINALAPTFPDPVLRVFTGTVAPILGASGAVTYADWTLLQNASADDASIASGNFGFNFTLNNTTFNSCFIGSNGYLTFGAGSDLYTGLSAASPALPKIMFAAEDNSYQRVFTKSGITGGVGYFKIRFEGSINTSGTVGSPTLVYEFTFYAPPSTGGQLVEVRIGQDLRTSNLFMIASATAAYAQSTSAPNTSWVFAGNSTGTSWTLTSNRYLAVS